MTSATTARLYRKELERHANKTGFSEDVQLGFLCHDFSMRGMAGLEASITSGLGHLTSFFGSETIPAIGAAEEYYKMDTEQDLVAATVPASEHSVMCAGSKDGEYETFKRFITELYPQGFVSIVSDTWDLWQVVTDFLPRLKNEILARNGRVVIRPDSGDPVNIICGVDEEDIVSVNGKEYNIPNINQDAQYSEEIQKAIHDHPEAYKRFEISGIEKKGVYELLWDVFGGTVNEKGYKVLDPHIGCLYGDSITLERQSEIYQRLEGKGFAATNLELGIGS